MKHKNCGGFVIGLDALSDDCTLFVCEKCGEVIADDKLKDETEPVND
jgi:hypothetical protein